MATLRVENADLAYDNVRVIKDLSVTLPDVQITALVGPNGCGKSTLLRGLARLLGPTQGAIYLDSKAIARIPPKTLARQLGLLPQAPVAPEGLLVEDLVSRGRYPHQSWLAQWNEDDEAAISKALRLTGSEDLRHRFVDELSGGQRQRVWIAMALAQETGTLLLDEPTTYLDIAYQLEIMELLRVLHANERRTIVVVLHDLNQACRYAHHIIALKDGDIVAQGAPSSVADAQLMADVFNIDCQVIEDPVTRTPLFIPIATRKSDTVTAGTPADSPDAGETFSPSVNERSR